MRRIWLAVVIGLAFAMASGWFAYHRINTVVRNAYAVWWVAEMTIVHMHANEGAWPKSWDDLSDDYETYGQKYGWHWPFDELRRRVTIDWAADPKRLAASAKSGEKFRVIWLTDGTDSHYRGCEPNEMLSGYLRDPNSIWNPDRFGR